MAITVRLTDKQTIELDKIKEACLVSTSNKAIGMLIDSWINNDKVISDQFTQILDLQAQLRTIQEVYYALDVSKNNLGQAITNINLGDGL